MKRSHWSQNRRWGADWATPRSAEGDGPLPAQGASWRHDEDNTGGKPDYFLLGALLAAAAAGLCAGAGGGTIIGLLLFQISSATRHCPFTLCQWIKYLPSSLTVAGIPLGAPGFAFPWKVKLPRSTPKGPSAMASSVLIVSLPSIMAAFWASNCRMPARPTAAGALGGISRPCSVNKLAIESACPAAIQLSHRFAVPAIACLNASDSLPMRACICCGVSCV